MAENDMENISDKPEAPQPPKNRVLIDSRTESPLPPDYTENIPNSASKSKNGIIWYIIAAIVVAILLYILLR